MKVQKIKTNGTTSYLLLGNNYERFPEVDAWVKFLNVKDASPGTIRTYLYNLMPYYEFLEGIGVKPLEIYDSEDPHRAHEIMMEFSLHLSNPKMSTTAINGKAPKDHTNEGVNRIISTVCNFYESLQALQIYDVPLKFTKTVSGSKYLTGNPLAELFFSGRTVKKNLYMRPTVEKPVEFIIRSQYSELFFALKNSRDRLAAAMMFECGMRAAERSLSFRFDRIMNRDSVGPIKMYINYLIAGTTLSIEGNILQRLRHLVEFANILGDVSVLNASHDDIVKYIASLGVSKGVNGRASKVSQVREFYEFLAFKNMIKETPITSADMLKKKPVLYYRLRLLH